MQCEIHPYKQCSFYNKKLDKLMCPLCVMPSELSQLVLDSSIKPLNNNSIIDLDLIESLAESMLVDQPDYQLQINNLEHQLLEQLQQLNSDTHNLIQTIFVRMEESITKKIYQMRMQAEMSTKKTEESQAIVKKMQSIKKEQADQFIETVTQLQAAIQQLKNENPFANIESVQTNITLAINDFGKSLQNIIHNVNYDLFEKQLNLSFEVKTRKQKRQASVSIMDSSFKKDKSLNIEQIKKIAMQSEKTLEQQTTSLAICNNLIIVGTNNGDLQLYDSDSFELIFNESRAHNEQIKAIAKSQNNQFIVSAANDRVIKIWKKMYKEEDCSFYLKIHKDLEQQVAQTLCLTLVDQVHHYVLKIINILLVGSTDNTVRIWNYENGQYLYTYSGHQGDIYGVQFVKKLQYIASASQDKTIRLWDAGNFRYNRQIAKLEGHTDGVTGLLALQEDYLILSCSLDKSLRVWDCDKKICLRKIQSNAPLQKLIQFQVGIAIALNFDNKLKFIDYKINAQIHEIQNFKQHINCYTVDEDNKCLLVGDDLHINLFY